MAAISTYPFVSHLRATQTSHIHHLVGGKPKHSGVGAAFWFRPLNSALSEVPVDDRERTILVPLRTRDLQQVSVPGVITYRVVDTRLAATRVDFSINPRSGLWQTTPLEILGGVIHGAAAEAVVGSLTGCDLTEVLATDLRELGAAVHAALATEAGLTDLGIEVVGVRFGLIRPEPDVERALQTPARESIQQEADKATFERRAVAVEREAAIGENELANQIELSRRRESLIAQDGANQRRAAEEQAAAAMVEAESSAEQLRVQSVARAEADRLAGQARADAERATMEAYAGVPQELLLALALRQAAENLPSIEQLVVTPDLVQGLLSKLSAKAEV